MGLKIETVLCRAGTMDNYAYIVTDTGSGISVVVDASEAAPVARRCAELGIRPAYILTTHHHFDHVGGNEELKCLYNLQIAGPEAEKEQIPGLDIPLKDGEVFKIGETAMQCLAAPGHTLGHMLWYFPRDKALFTGDVLFNLSIGGLFEGTPAQMWQSLARIKALPDDVLFYPGHEYTAPGLYRLQADNSADAREYAGLAGSRLAAGLPAGPITLGLEKKCNPYLQIENARQFAGLF